MCLSDIFKAAFLSLVDTCKSSIFCLYQTSTNNIRKTYWPMDPSYRVSETERNALVPALCPTLLGIFFLDQELIICHEIGTLQQCLLDILQIIACTQPPAYPSVLCDCHVIVIHPVALTINRDSSSHTFKFESQNALDHFQMMIRWKTLSHGSIYTIGPQ